MVQTKFQFKRYIPVALMLVTCAFTIGIISGIVADDSSADTSSEKTYDIYFEVVNSAGIVSSSDWIEFTSEAANDKFVSNANAALAKYGYPEVKFTLSDSSIGVVYNEDCYNNATYYKKDSGWAISEDTLKDYIGSSAIGLVLNNGYIGETVYDALTATEQAKWSYTGWGGSWDYVKLLDAKPSDCPSTSTYHYFVERINADGKIESSKWIQFDSLKTNSALAVNATAAFKESGFEKLSMTFSKDGITVLFDSSMNNSWYADGKEWKAVSDTSKDYLEHDTIALSVEHGYIGKTVYDKLSADDQKNWKDTGYSGDYQYQKVVSESTTGYKPAEKSGDDNNNTMIIIIAVIIAVIVIVAIAIWFFKFRK